MDLNWFRKSRFPYVKIVSTLISVAASIFLHRSVVYADALSSIYDFATIVQKGVIGIGLVIGVFIIPYAAILMASGNPDNIKKGRDWITSYASGLLIVLMSGLLVRIIGTEFLGI